MRFLISPIHPLKIETYKKEIINEIIISQKYVSVSKDILIVVRNQLPFIQQCLNFIHKFTENYKIFIYDNGSEKETKNWLQKQNVTLVTNEKNLGFIKPNNELIKLGTSPFIILLNSDTIVYPDWDKAMIAYLQSFPECVQVGYMGGILNKEGKGDKGMYGSDVDYIVGWCFCVSRKTYEEFGLFDEKNLEFAYCEDADFSLRLKESDKKIHSLHLDLVYHYGHITVNQLTKKEEIEEAHKAFDKNHEYIRKRWAKYLK
jgi:GT2 family glycosyltransferase